MEEFTTGSVIWKDATSYSRDQKVRKPTAWDTRIGKLRIYITNGHIYYRPKWIVSCHELGIDTRQLSDIPENLFVNAAEEALQICKDKADELANSFKNLKI